MPGVFTISLDFELHWGLINIIDRQCRYSCYQKTLQIIPQMLNLFAQYEVHVTWATVGSMFARNQEEWEQLKPTVQPVYANERDSLYKWVKENGLPEQYHYAHFAPETIKSILNYPHQEIGTHTFSHYYCLAKLKSPEAFKEDLQAARKAAENFEIQLKSLVFPRNQFNANYLKICYEEGIRVVRSNSSIWYWTPSKNFAQKVLKKFVRTANDYISLSTDISYPLQAIKPTYGEPLQLPRGRYFSPWQPYKNIDNALRLRRMCEELRIAAQKNKCYHLWWHPEDFGYHPQQNLERLRIVLQQYKICKERYGMQSWNMGEYADNLLNNIIAPAKELVA